MSRGYSGPQAARDQGLDLARLGDPHDQHEPGIENAGGRQGDPDGDDLRDQRYARARCPGPSRSGTRPRP